MYLKRSWLISIFVLLGISISTAFGQTALEQAIVAATSKLATTLDKVERIDRIAIVTLRNDQDNDVTDRLITAVVNSRKYQVIDRQRLEILFGEQEFQMTDVVDPDTARRAGRIAGVDAVIYGEIKRRVSETNYGEISMHARMVDVQTGEILYAKDLEHDIDLHESIWSWWKYLIIAAAILLCLIALLVKLFRRKKVNPTVIQKMVSVDGQYGSVDELEDRLSVEQPHAVKCRINLRTRKAEIDRIVLKLSGSKAIPGGWRGKIAIVEGIDRRYALADSIPLPTIMPGKTPINPGTVKIPRDVAKSQDSWALEFYIVDPPGGELVLFKSPSVSFV